MYVQVLHMPTQFQWLLSVLWTLTLVPRYHYYIIFSWAEERKEGKERQERERPDSRQVNACFIHCAVFSSNRVQYLYDALLQQIHRRSVHRTGQGGHCYQVSQDATLRVCRGVQVHCAYTHEYTSLSKTSPQDEWKYMYMYVHCKPFCSHFTAFWLPLCKTLRLSPCHLCTMWEE